MIVKEIMSKPISCSSFLPIHELAKIMLQNDIGFVPVVDDNKLIGVVTDRDIIIRAIVDGRYDATVAEVMTEASLVIVGPNDPLEAAFKTLVDQKVRRLLVVENDKLIGVVGLKDFLEHTHFADELKNIYEGKRANRFYAIFENGNPCDSFSPSEFRT